MSRKKVKPIDELLGAIERSGARVTFSLWCRSGVIGDLCECWRCREARKQERDDALAERVASIADRAQEFGKSLGLAMEASSHD